MVAVPYSSSKSTECTSAGSLFFFLNIMNGLSKINEIAEANTKPLDSTAAQILSKLNVFDLSTIWLMHSLNAFSFFMRVVMSLNRIPFLG